MSSLRTDAVLSLLAGEATLSQLAQRHAVSEAEVLEWKQLFLHGARAATRKPVPTHARRRGLLLGTIAAVAAGLVGSGVAVAQSGACAQTLPGGLRTFCADSPARASDVNFNFDTVYNLINGKLGNPTSPNSTIPGTLTVNGATSLNSSVAVSGPLLVTGNQTNQASQSFGSTTRQMINLFGTQYGIGVQSSTTYLRSAGDFAFFLNGTHSNTQGDPGTGGTRVMALDSLGRLSTSGSISAGTNLASRGTNVIKNITSVCGGSGVACPSGYTRIGPDLNSGAGGSFCYLCFQRAD